MRLSTLVLTGALAATNAAGAPFLSQPVDCTLGETCFIQNYVDHDPGPGFRDFTCGLLGYDGHKGTDFGLPTIKDMLSGVAVLAAADGVVTGTRDGMIDRAITPQNATQTKGRECGNGVVINHGQGWVTQYCHMKQGSIAVAQGQQVKAGDTLGLIGLSGRTEFPHLHMSLRHNDVVSDPFQHGVRSDCNATGEDLWSDPVAYVSGGLIEVAFAPAIPAFTDIKSGMAARQTMPVNAKALVLFAHGFGSQKGDVLDFVLSGPQGEIMTQSVVIDKSQARYFRATGKRTPGTGWTAGQYQGTVTLSRQGKTLEVKNTTVILN
ncbi:M23 family metallopeptidase [Shimia sp.]|uniref:M23 family metallopeptidase n=1 Tax=Shimia sp. TaxID=1954381 RepID=UPI00329902F3